MFISVLFIQSAKRGVADPFQPAVLDQDFDVTIDCRLVERFYQFATVLKDIIHPQWSLLLPEDLFYGHFLCRVTPQILILLYREV